MLVEFVRARETKPTSVVAREPAEIVILLENAPLDQVVEVAEAPGDQAEPSNAEQGIQDLAIDFDPDFAGAVIIVTAGMAHRRSGIQQDEEDHRTPSYYI